MKKQWMCCLLALAGCGSIVVAGSSGEHGPMGLRFLAGIHSHRRVRHHHARTVSGPHLPARFLPGAGGANLSLPLTFEPNVGQADPRARFIGTGKGLMVILTEQEIDVRVADGARPASGASEDGVRLRLAGSEGFVWRGDGKLRARSNYFIGRDRSAWRTRVPHFAGARAANAAPGVSLVVYGNDEGVEYDVRLAPGADVSKLRLRVSGASDMRLAGSGDLMLRTGETELRMKQPRFYEERKRGRRRRVDGGYLLDADGSIGFRAGPHDPAATLVVDPSLSVSYDTFLGGTGAEASASVAIDKSGKVYVGGTTTSAASFPETVTARLGPAGGSSEFFIAKIDPAASGANSLLYLTFLGGSGMQAGGSIAVDGSGNVAVTGTTTSTDFPVTDGSTPGSGPNATAVSELDPTGSKLVFSTLLGGSGAMAQAGPGGIAVDGSGNVYVASDTNSGPGSSSPGLPVTTNALQTTWDGSGSDGFLAVLQPPASPGGAPLLKYCSYLGTNSSGPAGVGGIAVDASGNAYIAGFSTNTVNGFPSKNALQTSYAGGDSDAFLMKISPGGRGATDLVYATLLGGSGTDQALAVAVDSASPPNAYLTGATNSADFPVHGATAGYQTSLLSSAGTNAFLAVVAQNSATGATSVAYATYLGGMQTDAGQGVAVAGPTAVYVTGTTTSWNFPWRDNLQPFNGAGDAFVAKLNPTLAGAPSLIWATPLGGTSPGGGAGTAAGNAVAVDGSGHVYVAGTTTSPDFPTALTTHDALNGVQPNCASCQAAPPLTDAFVAVIQENATLEPSVYFNLGRVSFPSTPVGTQSIPQPVGVLNGGEALLHIAGLAIAGPNAADFSLSSPGGCTGNAIAPGSSPACSFEVSFMPRAGGIESAVVTLTDDAPGSPQELELTGSGDAPLALAPTSLNFGALPQGATSPAQTVTLTNTSSNAIQNVTVVLSGPDAAQFLASGAACASIPSAGSCSLGFRFQPASTGTFHAEVDVTYDLGSTPQAQQVVPLTGIGTSPAPVANVTPSAITFGSTVTGSSSAPQTITLTNLGSAPLNLTSIAIAGTNPGDFAIAAASTTCPLSGGTLAFGNPAPACTVAVQFTPQTAGDRSASLTFTDNAAGSPQQVALSGTATAPPATLQVSPASLSFAPQSEGLATAPQSVTVTNPGTTAADISGIKLTGANAGDFVLGNSCAASLAAAATCQLNLSFSPVVNAAPGSRSASLSVPGGSPSSVALSGTATQAAISVPTNFDFGSQLAGTAASSLAPQPVTVTNTSTGPLAGALAITTATLSGANAADFVLGTDPCVSANTPPNSTCAIPVTFAPVQAASCGAGSARSATLTLQDNAPGSPHAIPLSGTAADFCFNSPTGQPVTAPVQAGQTATYTVQMDSSAGFTGSIALACTDPVPLSTCSITTTPATSPPSVQVSPTAAGQFTVSVTTTAAGAAPPVPGPPRGPARPLPQPVWTTLLEMLALVAVWIAARRAARTAPRGAHWARVTFASALLLALVLGMAACGGGGSDPSVVQPGTPLGTYTVTVKATAANGVARTVSLGLTVQ